MTAYKLISLVLILVVGLTVCLPNAGSAQGLIIDALKIFGIGYVVATYGPQINDFINNLAGQKGVKWEGLTKVVPIISVGQGTYVGAAQVQGPSSAVGGVKAVGQVETRISGLRGRLLIPVGTTNLKGSSSLSRVKGVGVSALVDFKI